MKKILGHVVSCWKYYAVGAAMAALIGALGFLAYHLRDLAADNAALAADLKAAKVETLHETQRADANAEVAVAYEIAVNEMNRTSYLQAQTRRDLNALRDSLYGYIDNAPESDDGPIAPVLAGTLDRLRASAPGHTPEDAARIPVS